MNFVPPEPHPVELFVRHFDSGLILIRIQHGFDLESGARLGAPDEIDDRLVVDQRLSLPVQTDERKKPVFDLVPLAGSRRVVTNRDGYLNFIRQALQVELLGAEAISVAAAGVGADQ